MDGYIFLDIKQCKKCAYKVRIKGIGEICYICGCPLKSKLRVPREQCGYKYVVD